MSSVNYNYEQCFLTTFYDLKPCLKCNKTINENMSCLCFIGTVLAYLILGTFSEPVL